MKRWPRIFRALLQGIIQPYSGIFRTFCNACICRNPAYLEWWNIQDPSIIGSRHIFRALPYLWKFTNIQNSDIFKIWHKSETISKIYNWLFSKIVKNYIYLSKALYLRSLIGFWIHLTIIIFLKGSILDLWPGSKLPIS